VILDRSASKDQNIDKRWAALGSLQIIDSD